MPHRPTVLLADIAIAALVMGGCVAAGLPVPSASGSPAPVPSGDPTAFYLRAWTTQAVAPESAFRLVPRLAISNGLLVDTAVAIPAIYPGPLLVEPFARPISDRGIAVIEDSLRSQGLLVTRDFTEGTVAGGATAHLQVVVGGSTYELSGDPSRVVRCAGGARCVPEPGTAEAFAALWQQLTGDPGAWLGSELGAEVRYEPERLAVLATSPVEVADGPIQAGSETWPLAPFSKFGVAYAGSRCGVVSGPSLESLLPVLRRSNQLTHFTDARGAERSLIARVLLPGEPDPCTGSPDGGHAPSPSAAAPSGLVPSSTGPASAPVASEGAVAPGSSGSGGSASGLGLPVVLGLGCSGGEPAFPSSAIAGPATAEQATDAPAQVLRSLVRDAATTGMSLPATGWRRVVDLPATVLFIAEVPGDPGYVSVQVDRSSSGTWARGGYGSCQPAAVLAAPFGPATWELATAITPADARFTALVTEQSCASGTEPVGRVSEPLIEYGSRSVTVTFGIRPLDGAQTCPSNPPVLVEVSLSEPLGDRVLLDGALFPPRQVEVSNPN